MDVDDEFEFFIDIIEQTLNFSNDQDKILYLVCQKLIELMKLFDNPDNKEFVKNALIVLIAISEDKESDLMITKGMDINIIPNQEKETVYNLLRIELAN